MTILYPFITTLYPFITTLYPFITILYRYGLFRSAKGNVIIKRYKNNSVVDECQVLEDCYGRRDPRQLDKDEEAWFDEEEEEFIPFSANLPTTATPTAIPLDTSLSITATPASVTPLSTSSPVSNYSKFMSTLKARTLPDAPATHSNSQGSYSPRPFTVGARLQMMERNRPATTMASYSMPTITAVSAGEGWREGGEYHCVWVEK